MCGAAFPFSFFGVVLLSPPPPLAGAVFPLALVERCCFPSFAFRLALLLRFLLGVVFLFLLLLGAGAALGPRRLIYRFVSFVFRFYFHVCGLFRVIFLLVFPVLFLFFIFLPCFHFIFIAVSLHVKIRINIFMFLFIFIFIFSNRRRRVEARATHLPEKSRSRETPSCMKRHVSSCGMCVAFCVASNRAHPQVSWCTCHDSK